VLFKKISSVSKFYKKFLLMYTEGRKTILILFKKANVISILKEDI